MMNVIKHIGAILGLIWILFMVTVFIADRLFDHRVKREVQDLLGDQERDEQSVVTGADLQGKPVCVQNWLKQAGIVGKKRTSSIRLEHAGTMRTEPEKPWMPFIAEYYYTADKPGFIWRARVKAAPLVHLSGRDMLYRGHGNMQIKLLSLVSVANASGKEIDQGSLLRYLAEIVWFPAAALNNYMDWEEINDNQAQATITIGDASASGIYTFAQNGLPVRFTARRYMSHDGGYSLENWVAVMDEYREFNGVLVPGRVQVTWDLPIGEFTWFRAEVHSIDYDILK